MSIMRIGRYEIEKELGRGAMAVVHKAVDPLIGRVVAIKTIRLESSTGMELEQMRQRLYREAQSAGNLSHPNIVTIYDIGEEENQAYITMEFIDGESLHNWMERNHIPPVEQSVAIIEQIASGLNYAAARGIIHRDIKPGNILLTPEMTAKIADFGIAKFSTSKITQTGTIMGTPAYMSPEQAMGRTVDGRSDIFSLGVIFYEMLTGERAFQGTSATTIIYKIIHEDPIPPRQLNVTLPLSLDSIVLRMLRKDPALRYQTCADLISDLRSYKTPNTIGSIPVFVQPADVAAGTSPGKALRTAVAMPDRRKPLLITLFALLVVVIAILSLLVYQSFQRGSFRSPKPAAPQASVKHPADRGRVPAAGPSGAVPPKAAPDSAVKAASPAAPPRKTAAPPKPAIARISLSFSGAGYAASVYDGERKLGDLASAPATFQVSAGDRRFRLSSEEVFLNEVLPVRLKADDDYSITLPGLSRATITLPHEAYNGCEISINGIKVPQPYPAQIPKLAAGEHVIAFHWKSGKYDGKQFASKFSIQENHTYVITCDPGTEKTTVLPIQ